MKTTYHQQVPNRYGYPVSIMIQRSTEGEAESILEYYDGDYYSVAREYRSCYLEAVNSES